MEHRSDSIYCPGENDSLAPSPQPTLLKLCLKTAVRNILSHGFADADFEALEPRLQRLLFSEMKTETKRLQEIEKCWRQVTTNCPSSDLQLYIGSSKVVFNSYERWLDNSDLVNSFRDPWNPSGERQNPGIDPHHNEWWDRHFLISETPDSEFHIFCPHVMSDEDDCSCEKRNWINTFEGRISPLLLLHRLILMIGIQSVYNASESIHYYLYYIHLIHEDGTSDLNFDYLSEDFVQIQFQGTEAASNEALKLLSSLCGVEDLHRV